MKKSRFFLGIIGIVAIAGFFVLHTPSPHNLSASLSLGENETLGKYVEGEMLVVLRDDNVPTGDVGSMSVDSQTFEEEVAVAQQTAEQTFDNLFPNANIETKILFDPRTADFSANQILRMDALGEEVPTSEERLVYATVRDSTRTTESLLNDIETLKNSGQGDNILSYQPNYIYEIPPVENVQEFDPGTVGQQGLSGESPITFWNIFSNTAGAGVSADEAWNQGITGEGVTVAVLDTGVDITHPDLQDNIWTNTGETNCTDGIDNDGNGYIDDCHGWDMGGNGNGVGDNDPVGSIFHGTHVAGIIAAEKNGTGAVGVAPDAKIMPLKIFDDNGFATTENFMEAMEYAWRNGADIASISLGRNDVCAELEQTAINKAFSAGVFIVASSGNEDTQHGMDLPFSNAPAVCENVFATGATNAEKNRASYSNYSDGNNLVDAVVPGGEGNNSIASTFPGGGYGTSSGTSMATPHAAGLAALLLQEEPGISPAQMKTRLCEYADDLGETGDDQYYGCGFLSTASLAPLHSSASLSISPAEMTITSEINSISFTASGGSEEYSFLLANGETGMAKQNCPGGSNPICLLSTPTGTGEATLTVLSGEESATSLIFVTNTSLLPNASNNISITPTASKTLVTAGDQMKYTIRFGNTTNEDYDSIKVVSDYDETKVTPVRSSLPSGCQESNGTITCTVGALSAGEEKEIQYQVDVR